MPLQMHGYRIGLLMMIDVRKTDQHIHTSVDSQLLAVSCQIIAAGIAPFLICIEIVVAGTLFVCAVDHILCLGFGNAQIMCHALDPIVFVCVNKCIDAVRFFR